MGFFRKLGDRIAVGFLVDISFERGQQGKPPIGAFFSDTSTGEKLREIASEAYEQGQKSVLVKIGNKIAGE